MAIIGGEKWPVLTGQWRTKGLGSIERWGRLGQSHKLFGGQFDVRRYPVFVCHLEQKIITIVDYI